jgi:hypothetical protein
VKLLSNKGLKMRIKNTIDWRLLESLFVFTRQAWSNWKKENRPIVNLIEKYFTDAEIKEFLENNKIEKLDLIKDKSTEDLKELIQLKNSQDIIEKIEKKKQEIRDLEKQLNIHRGLE